jgi:alpha-methylacyl-CoA racemase
VTDAANSSMLPLEGIRVLDLTRLLPGNYCTLALALLGADVIKVEDRGSGDYMREFGVQVEGGGACNHIVNRGKRSIALDLKDAENRSVFESLVTTSHALVESFRPGVLEKLGYPMDRLHELRPDLVVASLSGYGATGPLSQTAGHDINYLAFSGFLDRLGPAGGTSSIPPAPLADLIGGGLVPALLITAYLRTAATTGVGVWIDTSMAESIAMLPSVPFSDLLAGTQLAGRGELLLSGALACYDVYRLIDGQVAVGALEERFWWKVCDLVGGLDAYRSDHQRPELQAEIRQKLTTFFAGLTKAEVADIFEGHDACVTVIQSWEEMLESPQAQTRQLVQEVPGIPVPVLGFPAMIDGQRLPEGRAAPTQGEHEKEIRDELSAHS